MSVGQPYRSVSIPRHRRLFAPPPQTVISPTGSSSSRSTSRQESWEKATPSITARIRWALVCMALSPKNTPRQCGSGWGERSPIR